MDDCNLDEEKTKKLKKICNESPPHIVPTILLGILFLGVCPAGLIWVWAYAIPQVSKVLPYGLVLSIFMAVIVIFAVFGVIPYLHQFFFYKLFPGRFMGLKGPWWDRGTARYDLKHKFTTRKNV